MASASSECIFGTKCFRRNPHHFKEYSHAHLARLCADFGPEDEIPTSVASKFDVEAGIIKDQVKIYRQVRKIAKAAKSSPPPSKKRKTSPSPSPAQPKPSPQKTESDGKDVKARSVIQRKLEAGRPLNMYLTKVKDSPETHKDLNSIYFTELLHPSLGKLKRSLQINFMVEWDWLWMNYEVTKNKVPLQ